MRSMVWIIKNILKYLALIIGATVGALGFFLGFGLLHGTLAGASDFVERSDFIIYGIPGVNSMIGFTSMILIIVVIIGIKVITPVEKPEIYFEETDSSSNIIKFIDNLLYKTICFIVPIYLSVWHFLGKNKAKILFGVFIFALGLGYYSLTDYSIVYEDTIIKHSAFNPSGTTYNWTDIEEVQVGVKNSSYGYDYYYILRFKDNSSININDFAGISSKLDSEDAFISIDHKVKELGINKIIDRTDLEKWGTEYDKQYVEKIQRLFED